MLIGLGPGPQVLKELLDAAEPEAELSARMHAPTRSAIAGRLETVWRQCRKAILDSADQGTAAAQAAIVALSQSLDELLAAADEQAERVTAELQERLRRFLKKLFEWAMAQVPAEVRAGGQKMTLTGLKIATEHKFGGSLKASLAEVISLVADGTVKLEASYAPSLDGPVTTAAPGG